jgi:Ca2+-binding EF-hand superfamily protein
MRANRRSSRSFDDLAPAPQQLAEEDIELLIHYLDNVQMEFGQSRAADGVISVQELEQAFRRTRRQKPGRDDELDAKQALESLMSIIAAAGVSLVEWFQCISQHASADTAGFADSSTDDRQITRADLARGMKRLQRQLQADGRHAAASIVAGADLTRLFKLMDEDCSGEISLKEVVLACRIERFKAKSFTQMVRVSAMMRLLEDHMSTHGLRICDLYSLMDKDNDQSLTRDELRAGLAAIIEETQQRRAERARRARAGEALRLREAQR